MESKENDVKKEGIPRWINTILVSILLMIMSLSFAKQKELNENTEVLQIQLAIVSTKFDNHIEYAEAHVRNIKSNEESIHLIQQTYVTREEIRDMLNELKQYIKDNK